MDEESIIKWAKRLHRVLRDMPEGVEIMVTNDRMNILPAGFCARDYADQAEAAGAADEEAIYTITADKIIPNSEYH